MSSLPSSAGLRFHHLGLAVRKEAPALRWAALLGYAEGERIYDDARRVYLRLCLHATEPALEIITPAEAPGPVADLTQRHASGIVYHVCYETENLAVTLAALEAAGNTAVCISPPAPAPLFDQRRVSFFNVLGIGLVELLEPADV